VEVEIVVSIEKERRKESSMLELSWSEILYEARHAPILYGAKSKDTFLPSVVDALIYLTYEPAQIRKNNKRTSSQRASDLLRRRNKYRRQYFDTFKCAHLHLSPNQYLWGFACGAIRKEFDVLIDWKHNVLFREVSKIHERLDTCQARWATPFRVNTDPLGQSLSNLFFADTGFLAIRSQSDVYCQCYQNGWPVTPPMQIEDAPAEIGFVIGASLSKEWFPELPFTLDMVTAAIPEELSSQIRILWHDKDDLLPPRFVNVEPLNLIQSALG
jgi:hypothetical protein